MAVLLTGLALLAAAFVLQILLKHIWFTNRRIQGLLILYSLVPVCAAGIGGLINGSIRFSEPECVRLVLFYGSISLAYIAAYSAIESQSPTLAIVTNISNAGPHGRTDDELALRFAHSFALADRSARLEDGGLAHSEGGIRRLTVQGRCVALLFEYASHVLGLKKGG